MRKLDKKTVSRLASEQAVLDISNIVKELIDNSVDAHATCIRLTFVDFGCKSITILDDGTGIDEDSMKLALCRHATSKLSSVEDLIAGRVSTLGFRGEALASIAELSRCVTITSRCRGFSAYRVSSEAGTINEVKRLENISLEPGCEILVDQPFLRHRLRRSVLEKRKHKSFVDCMRLIQEYAVVLAGNVSFQVVKMDKENTPHIVLDSRGCSSIHDVLQLIMGISYRAEDHFLPFQCCGDKWNATGFFGHPINALSGKKTKVGYNGAQKANSDVKEEGGHGGRSLTNNQLIFAVNGRPVLPPNTLIKYNYGIYRRFTSKGCGAMLLFLKTSNQIDLNVCVSKRSILLPFEKDLIQTVSMVAENRLKSIFETSNLPKLSEKPTNGPSVTLTETNSIWSTQLSLRTYAQTHSHTSGTKSPTSSICLNLNVEKSRFNCRRTDDAPTEKRDLDFGNQTEQKNESIDSLTLKNTEETLQLLPNDESEKPPLLNESVYSARNLKQFVTESSEVPPKCEPNVNECTDILVDETRIKSLVIGDGAELCLFNRPHSIEVETARDSCKQLRIRSDEANSRSIAIAGTECVNGTLSGNKRSSNSKIAHIVQTNYDTESQKKIMELQNKTQNAEIKILEEDIVFSVQSLNLEEFENEEERLPKKRRLREEVSDVLRELAILQKTVPTIENTTQLKTENINGALTGRQDVKSATLKWTLEEISAEPQADLPTPPGNFFSQLLPVGCYNKSFIVCYAETQEGKSLYIVDQHAADEKYWFERINSTTKLSCQPLIKPIKLAIPTESLPLVEDMNEAGILQHNGFDVKITTEGAFLLKVPFYQGLALGSRDLLQLVAVNEDIRSKDWNAEEHEIWSFQKVGGLPRPPRLWNILAAKACHRAVRFGDQLTIGKMHTVVNNLSHLKHPWNCPHGRPTMKHLCHLR